jgi:carboxyl-terminal processing protease
VCLIERCYFDGSQQAGARDSGPLPERGLIVETTVYEQEHVSPLRLYHMIWNLVQENCFDPASLGDWSKWEHKFSNIYSDADAIAAADEMLNSLSDMQSDVLDPGRIAKAIEDASGKFAGIGIIFAHKTIDGKMVRDDSGEPLPDVDADGFPIIETVLAGGAAEKAGLKPAEVIVSFDGLSTKGASIEKLKLQVRGEIGKPVTMVVRSQNSEDRTLTVLRALVVQEPVTAKLLENEIGYIRLEDFVHPEINLKTYEALESLSQARALIIDLRGNPGGYMSNAWVICSLFVKEGLLASVKKRIPGNPDHPHYTETTFKLTRDALVEEIVDSRNRSTPYIEDSKRVHYMAGDRPIVVLVSRGTASAAELTSAALRHNAGAILLGTRTFGKGTGQSGLPLPNGCKLHLTTLRYYTPDGQWVGDGNSVGEGLTPDVIVEPNKICYPASADDNQLQEAIELLKSK